MTHVYHRLTTHKITNNLLEDEFAAWTYFGARALAEYLEDYACDTDTPLELDRVAIRCDFSEYATLKEYNEAYSSDNPFDSWDEVADNTTVIPFGKGSAIVQDY